MNIGLSFPHKATTMTGIRNLAKSTINETLVLDKDNVYYFFEENYITSEEVNQLTYFKKNSLDFMAKNNDILCYANNIDILHSYWDVFFDMKYPCKKVFTVYDLIPLIHPEWHYEMKEYFDVSVRKNVKCSDKIIAISENTKEDIVYYFDTDPDKVQVIYPGVKYQKDDLQDNNGNKFAFEYFLSVCTIEPRKNLSGIVKAYVEFRNSIQNSSIKLVLVGGMGWGQEINDILNNAGKYVKDIVVTGYVDETELACLYKNAMAFIYAPFYEGFGLPILEALCYGRVVISSDTSSLPEVGGEAVLYCNPYDPSSIAYAMQIVSENNDLVSVLKKAARKQVEKFSYKKAALETIKLYETLE